jgi:bifunctional non-homologous end joining protein LigD
MRNKGHLDLVLLGDKLKGRWHLIRTRKPGAKPGGKAKSEWLLFKAKDEFASETYDVVAERPESVVSGKRQTRGPTPAAVKRAAVGDPVALLVKVWPPALPIVVPTAAVVSSDTHLIEGLTRGPRAVAALSHKRPALQSDIGRDLAALFPDIAAALAGVTATEAVLDGEIADERPPRFIAHDLLWLDGRDVRARPIEERRELLVGVVPADDPRLACTPVFMGSGADARAAARAAGYARVLAKKLGSAYVAGESPDWLVFDDTADPKLKIAG